MASPSVKAGANINYLQKILTKTELAHVSKASTEKINKFISSKLEDISASKEIQDATNNRIEDAAAQLQKQVEELNVELQKSRENIVSLENEISSIKEVRNSAIDEKNNLAGLLASNNAEIERCRSEILELSDKLQAAVDAKCRALELNNEIQSKEFVLHEREKRMEEEKVLINTRISSLTEEIGRLTYELQTASLNNNAKIIHFETKLTEVNNELNTANELISKMGNEKNVLIREIHDLTKNILKEKDLENIVTKYDNEIFEKEKVCNMYKDMNKEATLKIDEMAKRIYTLEKLVQETANKNNELVVNSQSLEKEKENIVKEKNEELSILKNDLEKVKQQLKDADSQSLEMALSKLSPKAAQTIKLIKSDKSLTQLYVELHQTAMSLLEEKRENENLRFQNNKTAEELKKYVTYVQKVKEEQTEILENNKKFLVTIDELTLERNRLNCEITDLSNLCKQKDLEKSHLQKDLANLGRQICFLLSKHKTLQGNSEQNVSDVSTSESASDLSTQLIFKPLVTFGDIQELQNNNQKLLSKVRDLTEKVKPQEEQFDKDSYLKKIEELESRILELTDSQYMQTKMTSCLIRQRNSYKKLYDDHIQGKRRELSSVPTTNMECEEVTNLTNVSDESSTTENNLIKTQKQLDALDKEYKTYKEEKKINERMLYDQIESLKGEIFNLTSSNSKYCSRAEFDSERMKYLEHSITKYKKHLGFVEKKSEIYDNLNSKYEVTLQELRDELLHSQKELASAEVQVAKYKLECTLKTDRVIRLTKENEILSGIKCSQDVLRANLRIIEASNERKNTENNIIRESRLKDSILECEAIKKKYKACEDKLKEREEYFIRIIETTNDRLQEERNVINTLRNEIKELRQNLANRNKSNEELAKKLKIALRPNNSDSSYYLNKNKELEDKLKEKEDEITTLNEQLHKSNSPEMKQKWENIYILIKSMNDKQFNFKKDCENKIREYYQRIEHIKTNSNKLRSNNFSSNVVMAEKTFTPSQLTNLPEKVREELKLTRQELQKMTEIVDKTEQKYASEMLLHSEDIKKLTDLKEVLSIKEKQLKEITSARDSAVKKNEIDKNSWKESVETLKNENKLLLSRFEELSTQNNLLLDQIQSLSSQITHTTSRLSDSCNESNVSNMSVSIGEDTDTITSENMVKIINILRKEKDMAVAKSNSLQAESARLKSQMKIIEKLLENAKMALNNRVDMTTLSQPINQQAALLKKVETLDALTDSNRLMRLERDNLIKKVETLTKSVNIFENDVPMLNEKISVLTVKCNTLETENTKLKEDVTRWRNKVTILAERANKSCPEDWKRLQTEREALAKMLSAEKETVKKLYGELANLKTISEENSIIVQENSAMKEKEKIFQEQLEILNKDILKLTEDASKLNSELISLKDNNQTLTEQIKQTKLAADESKSKEIKLKNIAKKYKFEYEELLEKMKKQTEKTNEETVKKCELTELQNSLIAEKMSAVKFKSDLDSSIDREDKAKQLLKIAKSKIVQLTEEKKVLSTKIASLEQNDENVSSKNVNEKDNEALAQKSKEIESLRAQIKDLQSKLPNQLESAISQGAVEASTKDSLALKSGPVQTSQSEVDSLSATEPEYMPSSSSRSSSSQEVEYSESGPVTGDTVQVQHLPEVTLEPRLEPTVDPSAKSQVAQSTEASSGSVSSATTESRPGKRIRSSEPNTSQKKYRQMLPQTDDAEYEAPSSSRCDDDDDSSSRATTIEDVEEVPLRPRISPRAPADPTRIEASSTASDSNVVAPGGSDGDETVQPSTPKHYATRRRESSSEAMGSPSVSESSPRHRQRGRGRGRGRNFPRGSHPPPIP